MIRDRFSENLRNDMSTDEWLICQDEYDPQENLKNESLFALSNGYLGIRGSFEEGTKIHFRICMSMECLINQKHS